MKRIVLWSLLGLMLAPINLWAAADHYKKKGPVGIGGWVTFWDAGHKSIISFEKHADQIDRAYFELYKCLEDGLPWPIKDATDDLKQRVQAAAAKNGVETWYTTGNYDVSISDHNGKWIEKFLYDDTLRAKHIQMLVDYAKKDKVQGIQIDYENIKAGDKDAFSKFMAELDKAAKANGLMTGIALPAKTDASGTWDDPQSRDYAAIGKATDEFVPMTYDLHWSTSTQGCVTSPEWAEMCVKYSASVLDPGKIEVGYPAYGYDWVGSKGDTITWSLFQDLLKKYKVTPERDSSYSQELHISYTDEKGQHHDAWMSDSVSLEYQCDIVKRYKLYGIGVWYFGSEDESFWTTMKKVNATAAETAKSAEGENTAASAAPVATMAIDFLTDQKAVAYAYAYPTVGSQITTVDRQGKKWIDVVFKSTAWSGFGLGVDRSDLRSYIAKGALQFYVRGAKGGESCTVGFLMDTGLKEDEKIHFLDDLPMSNYVKVSTKWTLVTIPLADFSANGHHFDDKNGQNMTGPFKWEKVIEFDADHVQGSVSPVELQFSSIRVVPSYSAKAIRQEMETIQQ
jgi:spore germination protein